MTPTEYKQCRTCKETKALDGFYIRGKRGNERRHICKDCMREQGRRRWAVRFPPQPVRPLDDYPAIDDDFGHWLAGFTDGEGSFSVAQPRRSFICSFHISLRKDDQDILIQCRDRVDAGYVRDAQRRTLRSPNEKPCVRWDVGGKVPCLHLVEIFDRFPLRGKKANDYAIWRLAVIEWNRIGTGKGGGPVDWGEMARLRQALIEGREYKEPTSDCTNGNP